MRNTHRLAAFLIVASTVFAQPSKLGPTLQRLDPNSKVQVIVQFNQDPTEAHHQKVINRGGSFAGALHSIKSGVYSVPASALTELAKDPSVVHISEDHKLTAQLDNTAAAINAPVAWQQYGADGSGIGVAVIDSGMTPEQDFFGAKLSWRVVYSQDFTGGTGLDRYGHGEHIAGIIAGSGYASQCGSCTRTFKGIAPNANLINLRVLNQNGEAKDSAVIAAIETAIQLKSKYNIRVINLSLGRPVFESYTLDPLCQAAEAAWKAGIVVVVAAGNDGRDNTANNNGYGTIMSPGNDPYVITVGAMKTMDSYDRSDDLIASYSSKGPTLIDNIVKPDIVAPGNRVVSALAPGNVTLLKQYPENQVQLNYYNSRAYPNQMSNSYFILSGTSMAAGAVSGAVADMLQLQPNLTPDQVKARLMRTAYKVFPTSSVATDPVTGATYTSYYDVFTRGAGYIDLSAALADTNLPQGTALSPSVTFNSNTNKVSLVFDPSSVWFTSAAWGTSGVWGTSAVWGASAVWGTSVVAADNSLVGQSAVWGTSAAWGTSAVWGTSGVWGASAVWGTALFNAEQAIASQSAVWGADVILATATDKKEQVVGLGEQ